MRVLMTADTLGGVWGHAAELTRALRAHDVEVHLATMGPRPDDAQRADVAGAVTLHESDYRPEWMDDAGGDVARAGDWLLDLERAIAPDVVHLHGYAHGALAWRAPTVVVAHACVLSWWRAVKGCEAPASWDRYRAATTAGLRNADVVVAPTQAMLGSARRRYGSLGATSIVRSGCTAADFLPAPKEPFVLTVGHSSDEAANVATAMAAANGLPWPTYAASSETPAAAVHPLGPLTRTEIARWMARASICALPARYEPFGLTALQAALAGCALVLGDIPSLREVWGAAAIYVDPTLPQALHDALARLIADDGARTRHAAACRKRALTFTPARTAAGYLSAYHTAVGACV